MWLLPLLVMGCGFDFDEGPRRLVDENFAHFRAGTPGESGAKVFVSRKGTVRLTDRLDINGDGWLDLVSSVRQAPGTGAWATDSKIFWGRAGGFSDKHALGLPTVGSTFNLATDLDDDGHVDLVFTNSRDKTKSRIDSYIYWGSSAGFSSKKRSSLPTVGAMGIAAADYDRDGYLDLVLVDNFDLGATSALKREVSIYWGDGTRAYSTSRRARLPVSGGGSAASADLDGDGWLDLAIANYHNDQGRTINSVVYWGGADRFSATRRLELPTHGAADVSVADLDADGRLDLLFANQGEMDKAPTKSTIYWGDGTRLLSVTRSSALSTWQTLAASVADLNRDGHLDIAFSSGLAGGAKSSQAYIYWGPWKRGTPKNALLKLPLQCAFGNLVADFDRDGEPDLLFFNPLSQGNALFHGPWTASSGVSDKKPTAMAYSRAYMSAASEPGRVADRRGSHTFTSRVLDTGRPKPRYAVLSWTAEVPARTKLTVQLRSATNATGLARAPWSGPTSPSDSYRVTPSRINAAHTGQRYIQYRATLTTTDHGNTPVLSRVELSYR